MQSDPSEAATPKPALPNAPSSALARASAIVGVLSTVVCCIGALGGPIAVLLGMIALDRIRTSNGTLRGRGAAWTGIATGIAAVALSIGLQWGVTSLQSSLNGQLDEAVRATFGEVDEAGRGAALAKWLPIQGPVPAGAQIEAFARAARDRYGEFAGFSVASEVQKPDFLAGAHTIELALNYEFADARLDGVVVAKLVPASGRWMPVLLIDSMRIDDSERGALVLGAGLAQTAAERGEAKMDEVKMDEVKMDEAKMDEAKMDEAKMDEVKMDEAELTKPARREHGASQ